MNSIEPRKIEREEFLKLDEKDLMFITNPGRMGDEDGTTFVIKNDKEFNIYRIDGWMYSTREENIISLEEVSKQFPEWYEGWEHFNDKDYQGKYKYLYMGFGNGLSVDNSIYSEYEPYLNYLIEKDLEGNTEEEKESLKYSTIFKMWDKALIDMANDKKINIR